MLQPEAGPTGVNAESGVFDYDDLEPKPDRADYEFVDLAPAPTM
jgi:hypothetical protein